MSAQGVLSDDDMSAVVSLLTEQIEWVSDAITDHQPFFFDGQLYYNGWTYFCFDSRILYYNESYCELSQVDMALFKSLVETIFQSTSSDNKKVNPSFTGVVEQVLEGQILITVTGGSGGGITWGEAYVSTNIQSTHPLPDLQEGDIVRVVYNGTARESYPLQIPTVFAIYEIESNTQSVTSTGGVDAPEQVEFDSDGAVSRQSTTLTLVAADGKDRTPLEWERAAVIVRNLFSDPDSVQTTVGDQSLTVVYSAHQTPPDLDTAKGVTVRFFEGESNTGEPLLDSDHIASATAGYDETNGYTIDLILTSYGKIYFENATANNIGKTISMWLDDKMLFAPTVNETITDGVVRITGGNITAASAKETADAINLGLLFPLKTK